MKGTLFNFRSIRILFLAIPILIAFDSCSGYVNIEKRHYRNGYYVSRGNSTDKIVRQEMTSTNFVPEKETPVVLKPVKMDSVSSRIIPEQTVSISSFSGSSITIGKKDVIPSSVKVRNEKTATEKGNKQESKKPDVKTEAQKKKQKSAVSLFIASGLLLILGLLLAPTGMFFIVLAGVLTAGGLAVLFNKKKATDNNNATNSHDNYDGGRDPYRGFFLPLILCGLGVILAILLVLLLLVFALG